jgi:hypothetical protein
LRDGTQPLYEVPRNVTGGGAPARGEIVDAGFEGVAGGAPFVLLGEKRIFRVVLAGGHDEALGKGGQRSGAGGVGLGV